MAAPFSTDSRPVSAHGSQTTSLRPRNRRLISGLDEPPSDPALAAPTSASNTNDFLLASPFASPLGSRAPSPIPSKHPSRSSSAMPIRRNGSTIGEPLGGELATSLSGLWGKSWTSLQGLASNVLGSDAAEEMIKDKSPQRSRRPLRATHSQWGPPNRDESQPGAGSKEHRKNLVREKKRQELLMSSGSTLAESSRFKRRTSDDFDAATMPAEDNMPDALVYIHQVRREDTLAGLSIRFNCQLATIKRANRLWSNDAIQSRKTIVVPVDSCTVRGKRVPSPVIAPVSGGDSTSAPNSNTLLPQAATAGHTPQSSISASEPVSPQSSTVQNEEPPWRHDSWMQLDGFAQPVQIARMSRQDLGFFPRARRKSKSYSDMDTPSASFDLPRPAITVSDVNSTICAPGTHRKRGSSGSNKQWSSKMMGPGGVGTLGGKGASAPGPSTDKFTQVISKHLPNVAPPREPGDETVDDNASQTSGGGSGGGLESFGGAIEGWVRKLAQSAATVVDKRQQGDGPRWGRSTGDLIELSNAFEIGPDEEDEEDGEDERASEERRRQQQQQRSMMPPPQRRLSRAEGDRGRSRDVAAARTKSVPDDASKRKDD